jgi:hypothetical protein
MMRLRRASAIVACSLLTSAATAGPPQIIRTSQMWGTETSAGKTNARIGIAAECLQEADRSLTCQFVALSASTTTNHCDVVTWAQSLQIVRWTSDTVIWAGTNGPSGLAGVLTSARLTAKSNAMRGPSKTFASDIPDSLDKWNYVSTQTHTVPVLGEKVRAPVTTEVNSGAPLPPNLQCVGIALWANTPLVDY